MYDRIPALLALALATTTLAAPLAACDDDEALSRAYKVTSPDQLIGGNPAHTRVGDFILENDQIRIGILDVESSPAPGVFGGTLVDADLQRPESRFRAGQGNDQFAELFPVVNLLFPRPGTGGIEIIESGADGAATIRVTGEAGLFLEALSVLKSDLLSLLFDGVKVNLDIQTDYILEPGKRYLRMRTRAVRTDTDELSSDDLPLDYVTESLPIFTGALGSDDEDLEPGLVGGDFVFFGAKNNIFAPGIGFDETKPIFDALFEGRDTFTYPLAFDFMAAAGGDVSYGYFNTGDADGPDPKVLVPIITSSSTGFITHAKNCSTSGDDDDTCDRFTSWTFERYFVVGKGDVASVADEVFRARGTPVGTVRGVVRGDNGQPLPNAKVFLFRDPDPSRTWGDIYAVVDQNYRDVGSPGVLNAIDADVGRDPVEDGDFSALMPPGTYLAIAQNAGQTSTSPVYRVTVEAGEKAVLAPVVPAPGRVAFRVTDDRGGLIEAKLTFVSVLPDGTLAERDGLRRPYMGEGRLGNGIRYVARTSTGMGTVELEAGSYELIVTRGPEYSADRVRFDIRSGQDVALALSITHEVDTDGWIAGDFHLHSEESFDSGIDLINRVRHVVAEGLELAVATDHDIVTDYGPAVRELQLQDRMQTGVGVELSTLELGHFIGFPLAYHASIIPDHGAPDWTCLDGPAIIDELQSKMAPGEDGVKLVAHPRDGFIGYISQLGVSPYDFTRELDFLEQNNVLLARTTCAFDGMEVFNSKRFDLVRTPTNEEVILYNRCNGRIDVAETVADLDAACPELSTGGPLASCPDGERFFECKQRYRRRLAFLSARDILIRTPEEQLANKTFTPGEDDADNCDPAGFPDDIDGAVGILPCVEHVGTYDEWLAWLAHGLNITIVGGSDSHGGAREPGCPRTWVKSDAQAPVQIDVGDTADTLVEGKALASYGPFVEVDVLGKGPGETVSLAGDEFLLNLKVQTASWFGVDRLEIYVSGLLEQVIELDHGPEKILDFHMAVPLPVPDEDGFVAVVALGTREENLFGAPLLDVPFGELQLPKVAALAFGAIPGFSLLFSPGPSVPDFFPVFPMATTNAILIDVDGDGQWQPAGQLPDFCPRDCDPAAEDPGCPIGQICLESGECALNSPADGWHQCETGPPGTEAKVLQNLLAD